MATAKTFLVGLGLLALSSSTQAQSCPAKARRGKITRQSGTATSTCEGQGDGPYGVPPDIPGRVLAADFDCGGEGTAYHDTDALNKGYGYRTEDGVDIAGVGFEGEYAVGWTAQGEYLRFNVTVPNNVPFFDFIFKMSSPQDVVDAFRIVTGGTGCEDYETDLSGPITVDGTPSSYDFTYQRRSGRGDGGLPAGSSHIWLCFEKAGPAIIHFDMIESTTTPSSGPWGGFPPDIPGEIEVEEFDYGGQDVAYFDTTPDTNLGGEFRPEEGVDIYGVDDGYAVGWIEADEELAFTVNVTENVVAFDFSFQVSSEEGVLDAFSVVAGGTGCADYEIDLSGLVTVPATGDSDTFEEVEVSDGGSGGLLTGVTQIWMCMNGDGFAVDSFTMTVASLLLEGYPFDGVPAIIPGWIQAENFDEGGLDVAYYDTTSGNNNNVYRPNEDVDIGTWFGGYLVDSIAAGEYLRFIVDVSKDVDTFDFVFTTTAMDDVADAFRVVSGEGGCDDFETDLSGPVTVLSTGVDEFMTFPWNGIGGLPVGYAYVWLCVDTGGFAIDSIYMADGGGSTRKKAANTRKKTTNTRRKAANTQTKATNTRKKAANTRKATNTRMKAENTQTKTINTRMNAANTRKKAPNTRMTAGNGPNKGATASAKRGQRGGRSKCS